MCLFQFSTCFEQPSAHHQENQLYQYNIWYMSLCVGDIYQMLYWYNWFSWWWARCCSKHVENWNKHIDKNCASSWSFTKNHSKMHGQQNIKSETLVHSESAVLTTKFFKCVFFCLLWWRPCEYFWFRNFTVSPSIARQISPATLPSTSVSTGAGVGVRQPVRARMELFSPYMHSWLAQGRFHLLISYCFLVISSLSYCSTPVAYPGIIFGGGGVQQI